MGEEKPPYDDEVGFTLDDLHQQEVDVAGAQAILKRALPPDATYETNPDEFGPMTVSVNKQVEKRNGIPTGTTRTVIQFFGRGVAKNVRDSETGEIGDHTAGLRFRISPDARKKVDWDTQEDTEKDDRLSMLYAQAVQAYKVAFSENPKSIGSVVEYLRDNAVRYRMIRTGVATPTRPDPTGEPGTMVVAISAKRVVG